MTPHGLTMLHRQRQLALKAQVRRDATSLWPALDFNDLDGSFPKFLAAAAPVVSQRRQTSSGLAAAYLRTFKAMSTGSRKVDVVRPTLTADELRATLLATSVVPLKQATANGTDESTAMSAALVLASGALVRLALNGGRETVALTAAADPAADGYVRVLGAGGCDFCQSLADEPLHTAEAFPAHGNCGCTAAPVYRA